MLFKICCLLFAVNFIITILCGCIGFKNYDPHHIHWYDRVGLWTSGLMIFFAVVGGIVRLLVYVVG